MTLRWMLDTNVCIHVIRDRPPDLRQRFNEAADQVCISAISLAKLLHHDCICVRRSQHQVRFLHPRGWSYYATLRRKLHWNAGGE